MTILGLRTTIYMVEDLERAREWYGEVFGVEPYFDNGTYVGYSVGGYELGLMEDNTPANRKSENVLSYWGVERIEEEFEKFLERGASEHERPVNVGGEIRVASVKDPWGNVIGLIYNPEFDPSG